MPRHVVVDGSNLATEGRSMPSLKQLVDAVAAFMEEHPTDLITVVVDATFGHRIDPREVAEFDAAIEHNELVAPPAGAVGRGDAFVLAIANKVNATIISNDSYQEFHADHDWLFDEGRLIGGKPVPHVGWVFVPRVPVRGPLSRKVTRDAKRKDRPAAAPVRSSREASRPMPVPSAPPPGARVGGRGSSRRGRADAVAAPIEAVADDAVVTTPAAPASPASKSTHVPTPAKSAMVNDVLPFLAFVEHHPVGSVVEGIVESYASHGAYVTIGDARGYVPLRLMSDPPPRSAREAMKIGDTVTLHVAAFHGSRRGIDLSTPEMAGSIAPTQAEADDEAADQPTVSESARKRRGKARPSSASKEAAPETVPEAAAPEAPASAPAKRGRKKAAAPSVADAAPVAEPSPAVEPAPAPAAKRARKAAPAPAPAAADVAPAPAKRARKATPPAEPAPAAAPAPASAPDPAPAPAKKAAKKATKRAAPAAPAAAPVASAAAPAAAKKASPRKKAAPASS